MTEKRNKLKSTKKKKGGLCNNGLWCKYAFVSIKEPFRQLGHMPLRKAGRYDTCSGSMGIMSYPFQRRLQYLVLQPQILGMHEFVNF